MRINELSESTVAGSIATVASPLGATQTRSQKPPKAPKVAKGKKYANVISEGKMKELAYDLEHMDPGNFKKKYGKTKEEVKASLSETKVKEAEVLIVPGMRRMKDKSFISHKEDRRDHEVEMARSDLYAAAKNAMRIFQILKNRSEDDGLMGWQQSYITLAADYLNSVADSLEYDAKVKQSLDEMTGELQGLEEGKRIARKPGQPANSKKHSDLYTDENPKGTITGLKFATADDARASVSKIRNSGRSHAHKIQAAVAMEQRAKAAGKSEAAGVYRKFINSMKKKTDEASFGGMPYDSLSGFQDPRGHSPQRSYVTTPDKDKFKQDELSAELKREKDPKPEDKLDEKKDACYSKVKSRYKVWPSAYASGALVKCRKVGAANWGNKSKK